MERAKLERGREARVKSDRTKSRAGANRTTFTDLGIKRLKPPKAGQRLYWDVAQRGLGLLVSSGGTKSFRSQYRLHGRWMTRTLGRFGEMKAGDDGENVNVATAREMARNDRAKAKAGIDPRESEDFGSDATFEAVVDQFIEQHAKRRQRTWMQTEGILKNNCAPWLRRPFASITKKMAYDLLEGIVADGRGPTAKLTQAWLRTLWKWAYRRDIAPAPLMDAVEIEVEPRTRDRHYTDDEVGAVWRAAERLGPTEAAYVKLLLLLAPRKTALAQMRWSHLNDPDNPTLWTTPHELTKSKKTARPREYLTPLPPLAQRIIKGLPARPGEGGGDGLLFPSSAKAGVPIWPGSPLVRKLARHGAPVDFTFHAVRHTVATWLQNQGRSEFGVGLVLNHQSSGVTAGYSHGYPLDLKRELLEMWAKYVEGLVAAEGVTVMR